MRTGWRTGNSRSSLSSKASDIYGGLVAQARSEPFYAALGVPDTPEGRLEMIMLHVALAVRRLNREGADGQHLSRAVMETFVTDMDDCLREMGVGDMAVAKKVKKAAAALYDRVRDLGAAIEKGDRPALADLLGRHVVGSDVDGANALAIADYALQAEAQLAMLGPEALTTAQSAFPAAPASAP